MIDEGKCKGDEVQNELTILLGVLSLVSAVLSGLFSHY